MTEHEVYLLSGFMLGCFGAISTFSALVDGRTPRLAAVLLTLAAGSAYMANKTSVNGIHAIDVPNAFIKLAAQFIQ